VIVTDLTRELMAIRRETRRMLRAGYSIHETDWRIIRGLGHQNKVILDVKISADRKHVWVKVGEPV
jgi:hypothetical protein